MRISYNSPVILTFSILSTMVYFISQGTGGHLMNYFIVGESIDISNPRSILTMFSHVMGHGSLEHLLGNMTFVLLLGPIIEEKYGSRKIMIMILITAFITSILNAFFFNTGLLGASGIVFMLIILVSITNVRGGQIPLTFILVAALFIGKEVMQSINTDNISQFAHIIGGFCGSFFGFSGLIKKKSETELQV